MHLASVRLLYNSVVGPRWPDKQGHLRSGQKRRQLKMQSQLFVVAGKQKRT